MRKTPIMMRNLCVCLAIAASSSSFAHGYGRENIIKARAEKEVIAFLDALEVIASSNSIILASL